MFHNIFKLLSEFVKDKPLSPLFNADLIKTQPKALCDTYVLATTIDNPASLFIDHTLADSTEGFYICSNEQPWSSAVAYIGQYLGRVAIRSNGYFNISDKSGLIQSISYKFCTSIHKKDGYGYTL